MAAVRTPRASWIDAGLRALGDGGPDSVRVEALAKALGVTKGGFYWHYDDRDALLAEMLDAWEHHLVDDVITLVDEVDGDARARLRQLWALASARDPMLKVELAVRSWARRDRGVAARLRRVDNRRIAYLRSLFREICASDDEVEARATLAMTLFVGTHFIAPDHSPRTRSQALSLAAEHLLA